ncbi:hypothetical protein [Jannaschia formosa]|uniref:hypothetical protein n=1 Tax=Jannaschia formosa TaxID=2259592 RepID=UPI000E1BC955|nr:hypothetical protein [Jannaschia formosa]TFL16434.1 hypothetical protein DR046_20145 [Jannaschia formosa]
MTETEPRLEDAITRLRDALAALKAVFTDFVRSVGRAAVQDAKERIARMQRIDRIIAMIPQYGRINPMCRDPWQRERWA